MQRRLCRPSTAKFIEIVGKALNCFVTRQDILNAEDIFGPDIGSLKGKNT